MTWRLRSMVVDSDRTILVLDRLGKIGEARAGNVGVDLQSMAERIGLSGGVCFGEEVDLPDDPQPEGLTIHADELAALRWALTALDLTPVGDRPGELRPDSGPAKHLAALRLLIQRAEQ